jgi:hypothetical protein
VVTRAFVVTAALGLLSVTAGGCANAQQTLQREFTPGQLETGSHIHAFQAASFVYGFTQSHMMGYQRRLEQTEDDVPAFYEAIDRAGWTASVSITPHLNKGNAIEYEYYDVDLVLTPKDPKSKERFVIPGAEGTRTTVYVNALGPAAKRIGVPAEVIRRGHFALFGLATLSGAINASDDSMKRQAFGLLVLKEKLKRGERADYLAPLRPANESIEDVDYALRVIADHHRATARMRAEVIGLTALTRTAGDPTARAALVDQLRESRKTAHDWLATHDRPQMDQYGIRIKELKLPTPENMLAVLDKDGYITAAVEVAKGVATGDAGATVAGFAKLAPKGSSIRIAAEGTAAALKGDIGKAADCALQLAERQEDIAPLAARLRQVEAIVTTVHDTGKGIASAAKSVPTTKGAIEQRAKDALKDAGKQAVEKAADSAMKRKR